MFNKDFYPTPPNVIKTMTEGENLVGKTILEPSAGKGNIVDFLTEAGANVISCENNQDLKKILQTKCRVIADDFLTITSDMVSHIDYIIMNPPFSAEEAHILHAFNIAPPACKIISLCNYSTVENPYTNQRKQLCAIIDNNGSVENIGQCFSDAERETNVNIGLIKIKKPGAKTVDEFEGFFMEEEPEQRQEYGLMNYNIIRDLVNRYIQAVKTYREVLNVNTKLNNITGSFFYGNIGINISLSYEDYKKELQKSGWNYILNEMNLLKYTTRGVREDINKFVEQQTKIPFTMRNIYHMLDIVVQTAGQRMDKAILEAFDRVTEHHHENRYNIKGWKTNSHFLVGKKFILPRQINQAKEYGFTSDTYNRLNNPTDGIIPDLEKALCYITGDQYEESKYENYTHTKIGIKTVNTSINRNTYGEWYESHFFKYKGYKNGNMHYEFKDDKVWQLFNKRVAQIKGYPLFEAKEQTAYQNRNTGRKTEATNKPKYNHTILTTIKIAI